MSIQGIGQSYMPMQMMNRGQGQGFDSSSIDTGQMFEDADANGDGVLSIDETPLNDNMFSKADADGDGELTQEEMEDMLSSRPPMGMMAGGGMMGSGMMSMGGSGSMDIEQLFAEEDTDEDGTISAEETSLPEEMFSALDKDGDGKVTSDELEQAIAEKKEQASGSMHGRNFYQTSGISAYQDTIDAFISNMTFGEGSAIDSFLGITA